MNDFARSYGPWALIAGASEGTGAAFARKIAAYGLNCILVARREGPLDELARAIRDESGVACVTASVDLAADDAADRLAELARDHEVGLFVNNAGADPNGAAFLDRDIDTWIELAQRNVITTMRNCHHFGGLMRARGRGGIILVGSGACWGGIAGIATYGGAKAFDLVFGEALWAELRPHHVDVLNLILGQTDTPAFRAWLAAKGMPIPPGMAVPDEVAKIGLARLPHGPVHVWGQADDEQGHAPNSAAARRARILAIGGV